MPIPVVKKNWKRGGNAKRQSGAEKKCTENFPREKRDQIARKGNPADSQNCRKSERGGGEKKGGNTVSTGKSCAKKTKNLQKKRVAGHPGVRFSPAEQNGGGKHGKERKGQWPGKGPQQKKKKKDPSLAQPGKTRKRGDNFRSETG